MSADITRPRSLKSSTNREFKPNPDLNSLPKISATSYALGIFAGISATLVFHPYITSIHARALPTYAVFISLFHFLEYYITATYQPARVTDDSFVLDNPGYKIAHTVALIEYLVELYFIPNLKSNSTLQYVSLIGLIIVFISQLIRTLAMRTAGMNFSHLIKNHKEDHHQLVTHGVYAIFRHPSYFGFFYWALGTQILLLNPVSFILFAFLLHDFFGSRIPYEEYHLIKFFGNDYLQYRTKSYIAIPFINPSKNHQQMKMAEIKRKEQQEQQSAAN
jgi:protein-S-isoprenylcysteine O-methyltransferase